MSDDTAPTDWAECGQQDQTDISLITSITNTLTDLSGENRARRRREKIRAQLVREHIEAEKKKAAPVRAFFRKLFRFA